MIFDCIQFSSTFNLLLVQASLAYTSTAHKFNSPAAVILTIIYNSSAISHQRGSPLLIAVPRKFNF